MLSCRRDGVFDTLPAAALHEQRLETNRVLGDKVGIAAALWDLAQLDLSREDVQAAAPRVAEAYQLVTQSGRAEGIAVIGTIFGQMLAMSEHRDQGLEVLRMSCDAYRKLGRDADASEVADLIAQIEDTTP